MRRNESLPYRTASADSVRLRAWHYRNNEDLPLRLGDSLPGWDYNSPLFLARHLEVDTAELRRECGIEPDAPVQLVVLAECTSARYREPVLRSRLTEDVVDDEIELSLDSRVLADQVVLTTEIYLDAALNRKTPFTAWRYGSRLFSETVAVRLEGTRSRFPVEVVEFESRLSHLHAPQALWYLMWNGSDLTAPAMQSIRLYLNGSAAEFVQRAISGDPSTVSMMSVDVARQLIIGGVGDPDFVSAPGDYAEGSVGNVVFNLMRLAFPRQSPEEVAVLYDQDASRFEAMIQSSISSGDV